MAEGFCEFIVTRRPEFARGCMGNATGRDSATKKKKKEKLNTIFKLKLKLRSVCKM